MKLFWAIQILSSIGCTIFIIRESRKQERMVMKLKEDLGNKIEKTILKNSVNLN
jgi:hypothetical protein